MLTFPLAGFDLESTSTDAETARIVQICCGVPGGSVAAGYVNPGIPIPVEASEVHHITDAMVETARPEGEAAELVADLLYHYWRNGTPIVGTNICYDFTLLDRALRRAGKEGFRICGPVIDTYVLDKAVDRYRKGSRKLIDTARHYGVPLGEDAHDARVDTWAAVQIAVVICSQSPMVRSMDLRELYTFQQRAYYEQKVSLYNYFQRNGIEFTPEPLDWPIRPWRGEENREDS